MDFKNGIRLLFFIKKSNDEENDFNYMGDVTPKDPLNEKEVPMEDDYGNSLP